MANKKKKKILKVIFAGDFSGRRRTDLRVRGELYRWRPRVPIVGKPKKPTKKLKPTKKKKKNDTT